MQGLALATALEMYLSIIQFFRLSILGSPHHLTSPSQPLPRGWQGGPDGRGWRGAGRPTAGPAALLASLAFLSFAKPRGFAYLHGLGMRDAPGEPRIHTSRPAWVISLVAAYYLGFAAFAMAQPQTPMTLVIKPCIMSALSWLPTSAVAAQLSVVMLPACLVLASRLLRAQRGLALRLTQAAALAGTTLLLSALLIAPALGLALALCRPADASAATPAGTVPPLTLPACRAIARAVSAWYWGLSTYISFFLNSHGEGLRALQPVRPPLWPLEDLNLFANRCFAAGTAPAVALLGDSLLTGVCTS